MVILFIYVNPLLRQCNKNLYDDFVLLLYNKNEIIFKRNKNRWLFVYFKNNLW